MTDFEMNEMIQQNEKLVYFVLNRSFPTFTRDEELYQCGLIGLWKACLTFDDSKGSKFSTYAVKCIKNEIRFELRKRSNQHAIEEISLDESLSDNDESTFKVDDIVTDPKNSFSEVECDISFLRGKVKDSDYELFQLYLEGTSMADMGRMFGYTRAGIQHRIKQIQKKAQRYIKFEDLI